VFSCLYSPGTLNSLHASFKRNRRTLVTKGVGSRS
jgi:hypothetical protein